MRRPSIVIVSPAMADANNGNWQTARRWAALLRTDYPVRLTDHWAGGDEAVLIALHARRSASAVQAWRTAHPQRPLVLVMTGTDLYRDIHADAQAQHSLALADRLVVLNERGLDALPATWRAKGRVCLQSTPARAARRKPTRHLRALMVGHLREEKSPHTYFEAARRLADRPDIRLDHIGAALDPELGDAARATMAACPNYRWLGGLPRSQTRSRIQSAHLLVHASRMEGGAHVVIEALTSGTAVLASRIDGNLGLLGADYRGCFDWGDSTTLAAQLVQARDEPATLAHLAAQCAARAPRFEPAHERATLRALLRELLPEPAGRPN